MCFKQKRSTEECSKLERSVDMADFEMSSLNIGQMKVPNETGSCVRRSKLRLMLASYARCKCSIGTSRNNVITSKTVIRFSLVKHKTVLDYSIDMVLERVDLFREKTEESWLSSIKNPLHRQKAPQSNIWRDNTQKPPKSLITPRLRTDCGQSFAVPIATQLVLWNRITWFQPSHSPQQLCNQGHESKYQHSLHSCSAFVKIL